MTPTSGRPIEAWDGQDSWHTKSLEREVRGDLESAGAGAGATIWASPFFGPYNTHQATPLGNPLSTSAHTGRPAFWSGIWNAAGPSRENPQPSQPGFDANNTNRSQISPAEFDQLAHQLKFIDENDEYADIASGDKVINDSLVDTILEASGTDPTTEPVESSSSEAVNNSVLQNQIWTAPMLPPRRFLRMSTPPSIRTSSQYRE
ncbi:hypothetical protein B0H17DRAFT_1188368 [Mycena rosella]|uniref:Uncharacterized protein n=1 Tax=Mycena rosella TaxID=1033263 RepID=A0AAD7FI75_MYCRO|nr:hypothetical protein B0H17DRAFT_1188368 [Mycena rosella]